MAQSDKRGFPLFMNIELWFSTQARSQVLRFGGENTFLEGHDFCFYIFKTNFSANKKMWGVQKKFGGNFSIFLLK